MAFENSVKTATVPATEDLSGGQYKAVQVDGTFVDASGDNAAAGIILNKPQNGDMATVAYQGLMKGVAGDTVAAGAAVMVANSGFLLTATSGYAVVGKCWVDAANSGDTFTFMGNFMNGHVGT